MSNFHNRVRVATATTGTGTITLGQASAGYASFQEGGVADGGRVVYTIEDGNNFEVGNGVYSSSGQTLTRPQVLLSKVNGEAAGSAPLSLSGSARVFLTATAEALTDLGPHFSVRTYGAVGDGSTNDHVAFQAAIAAADASLFIKTVYVPHSAAGYVFGDTVVIPDGVTIRGDNLRGLELSRIKPAAAFSDPLFETEGYGVTRVLRIGLVGLFLDGSSTTLTAVRANCQESLFQNLTIKNCFTYGLHIGGVGSGPTEQALNNHIVENYLAGTISTTEFFDGIFIDYNSADNTIDRNYIEASKDAGIRSRGYNNKITNNHVYAVSGTGGGAGIGIYTETSADHDLSSNYIENCAAEAILMAGGGSDVGTLAGTVHGNVCRNIDTGNTSNGVIEISGSDVSALTVFGNVVRRDAATSYATPYFVYFNGITPTRAKVFGNEWQANLITTAETNVTLPFAVGDLSVVNLTQTGYTDLTEIAEPGSPGANVARAYAFDDGGVTTLAMKDNAGNVVPISHDKRTETGAVTRAQYIKQRESLSVKDFGALGNNSADDSASINNAITAAASGATGKVLVPAGTYLIDATPVQMRAGIELIGEGASSIIKQANGADLNQVIDLSANNAALSSLRKLIIDGNRANNTGRLTSGIDTTRIVYYGNVNDVTIEDCIIRNGPGYGVHGASQSGLKFRRNKVSNTEAHNFFCVHTAGNFDADMNIVDNVFDNAILLEGINDLLIDKNRWVAALIGDVSSPMVVDVSGTTVTWVSGPTFANARAGQIIIADNGTIQCEIQSVDSSTQLTLDTSGGTANDVLAMIGENDLLGVGGCKRGIITNNIMRNGASFGISLFGNATQRLENCIVANNLMSRQGKNGFALLGDGGGLSGIGAQNIQIIGNHVINGLIGGEAGHNTSGIGAQQYLIQKGSGATLDRIILADNFAQDNAGFATHWLGLSVDDGDIFINSGNHQVGCANPGILNGISSVTLAAAWGNTATVTGIVSFGNSMRFIITANGTGIAANPQVTVNMAANKSNQGLSAGNNALYSAKMVSGTGTLAHLYNENFSTGTTCVFRYSGTPVAGNTYEIQIT